VATIMTTLHQTRGFLEDAKEAATSTTASQIAVARATISRVLALIADAEPPEQCHLCMRLPMLQAKNLSMGISLFEASASSSATSLTR